ncbi:response regulator [Spirochaeta lutea]|uniref:response regulator n=1 Tax=Spirochaeta lutea TaxID=1480694 RepID=UPI00068AC464|nr:adenylate/guanylate cyclase domain-containing protein [Spirochaeta lutea]
MSTFLVVDDEPSVERLIRQRFRKEIREGEFTFLFALNGLDAVETLKNHPEIDIVITDINMPQMDGLTLLNHIQEINPITKTIMISAYGDLENIRASMNRGAFDFITKPIDFEDLRKTMDKTLQFVEEIKNSLRSSKENQFLKMYVNPSVITFLSQHHSSQAKAGVHITEVSRVDGSSADSATEHSERIEGTVCFVDVCGFTSISEHAKPETITTLLNCYFDEIAEEAMGYNGIIDKFIGDAAMILFSGENHLSRAAECCLGIRERIRQYIGTQLAEGIPFPDISMGLHSGEMVSGSFGSKRISRLDYTVIGDTVNTAARIESISKPGDILMTDSGYRQLNGMYHFSEVGEVKLRNKTNPIRIYCLMGRTPQREKTLGLRDRA